MTLLAMNDNPQSGGSHPLLQRFEDDAIIVLAHHLDGKGRLTLESQGRIDAAIAAFQAKQAPCIITSGWDLHGAFIRPIAEVMREVALEKAVSPEAIRCDIHSRDTVGDAVFIKRNVIDPMGAKRLRVITSSYHIARAKAIFTFIYGPGYKITLQGVPSLTAPETAEKERQSLAAFVDTFEGITPGDDLAIWQRLRARHPFYNGTVYPAI